MPEIDEELVIHTGLMQGGHRAGTQAACDDEGNRTPRKADAVRAPAVAPRAVPDANAVQRGAEGSDPFDDVDGAAPMPLRQKIVIAASVILLIAFVFSLFMR